MVKRKKVPTEVHRTYLHGDLGLKENNKEKRTIQREKFFFKVTAIEEFL